MLLTGCCGDTSSYSAISAMGYDYIELSARQLMTLSEGEFQDFRSRFRETGFPCRGFNDFCGAEHPLVGPGRRLDGLKEYTRRLCRRGAELGIRTIGVGAPAARRLPEGYPLERADGEMAEFLDAAAEIGAEYGIAILAEAVHGGLCDYMTRTEEALAMVRRVDRPNVGLVLDYYHALVMGEDPHALSAVMPWVRHLHISTDLEHHARGFLREADRAAVTELLREALESGYRNSISVEAAPGLLDGGRACAAVLRRAAADAWEQAGAS